MTGNLLGTTMVPQVSNFTAAHLNAVIFSSSLVVPFSRCSGPPPLPPPFLPQLPPYLQTTGENNLNISFRRVSLGIGRAQLRLPLLLEHLDKMIYAWGPLSGPP